MFTSPSGEPASHRIEVADKAWYSVDQVGDCVIVAAGGEIDAQTASALRDALEVAAQFSTKIVLDLAQVATLDSAGLDVLAQARAHIRAQQGSVVLVAADGPVRATLQQAGLPDMVKIFERVAEAVAGLAGIRNEP